MSIESVMPSQSSHPVIPLFSCPQSFQASGSFPMSWLFTSGDQSIGALVSVPVLPMNIQDWLPLGLIDLLAIQGTLESSTAPQFESSVLGYSTFFMVQLSHPYMTNGEGNGKPLQYSCLENPMNSMKRQKDMTLKDEPPKSVDVQYTTEEEWRNCSRKNEEAEPKRKWCPVVVISLLKVKSNPVKSSIT